MTGLLSRIFSGLGDSASDGDAHGSASVGATLRASDSESAATEIATLGGGCFWCIDEVFRQLRGVQRVESGYAGGATPSPSYRDVCTGRTGHAEVVRVAFDPEVISYRELLELFFTIHDPTTLNRQGSDVGTQYRSVVLYHSESQRATAEHVMAEMTAARVWDQAIVTELAPSVTFHAAEAAHQDYYNRNPQQRYCQIVIAPKIAKFRQKHADKLRV